MEPLKWNRKQEFELARVILIDDHSLDEIDAPIEHRYLHSNWN
jgi:hypothetical protein